MDPPSYRTHSRFARSAHFSRQAFDTALRSPDEQWEDMSSRPKSMTDFQSLLDASAPPNGQPRKKASISLAQGLMMTSESPRSYSIPDVSSASGPWSENLFYAYAQKSDYAQSSPYILTFTNALIADQWWSLVQREYPESTRPGPQLFILKGDDMQEQIQDNPKFYDLRNSWFYTPSEGATAPIPLQDYRGNPVAPPEPPKPEKPTPDTSAFDMKELEATLDKMAAMITENTESIRALSVAQSTGLQTMQEINESTSTQIKALADNQAALQALVSQNASHYIALSNQSFSAQSTMQNVLQSNAEQLASLAEGQKRLVDTCAGMVRSMEKVGGTIERVGETMKEVGSDSASNANVMRDTERTIGTIVNRIQPPPRKLNRRIKGVWYEYDDTPGVASSEKENFKGMMTPRKSVQMLSTPPKSPLSTRTA
ncbi:hypothetical protein BU23DRAFT_551198 [Bimuria novae-zelandiae CBS 107.79]|uniref:Uncharacterized protein n=1 Tax=Bimuria novae-zelandiae CBS 107.79 TaxID=1447943 RepID=A0A6A5VJV6_9PLEO|nr:hypothetical protein BU23DRAFT_551198 [Bimuria novae-zelandiae CBS 107.79]